MATLAVAACGPALGPRTHEVVLPATGELSEPLPVTLTDATRRVIAMQVALTDAFDSGVTNPPGRQDQLIVTWLGGLCDERAHVRLEAVDPLTMRVALRTERADSCLLAGVTRSVILDLAEPMAADRVTFVDLDAPPE